MPAALPRPAAGPMLPLAFIALGLSALLVAVGQIAAHSSLLALPHLHPGVVALAHLGLPGFLLSICLGAIYQLMPVVLGAPLQIGAPLTWVHFALHATGVALLVAALAYSQFGVAAVGGGLVTAGVAILTLATWRTFAVSRRRDAIGWSFPAAVGWLAATVTFGVVLAVNRRAPFLPLSVLDLLRAHAHLGLAGFFLTLLQGATFQLVPMFTMGDLRRPGAVRAGLGLTQLGLLVLAPGLAWSRAWIALSGALLLALGVTCSGVALAATLRGRRRRILEPGLKAFALGAIVLALGALLGLALFLRPGDTSVGPAAMAYGIVLTVGALTLMVLGMLCKIVPFLVWMRAYGPRAGREPVPLATALGSRTLEHGWLIAHLATLAILLAGIGSASPALLALGAGCLLAATLIFLGNILRIAAHLWRPCSVAQS